MRIGSVLQERPRSTESQTLLGKDEEDPRAPSDQSLEPR